MASSSYFGFGRKPGLNGNSIYFAMTEEFNDDTMTGTKVKQLDEAKNVTSPVTGYTTTTRSDDYSKMNSSDGSNIFVPVAAINCISGIGHKPVLPEKVSFCCYSLISTNLFLLISFFFSKGKNSFL
ncbi:unnamed protein product [Brugia pahangi]|uniref:DUF295 domain-containing protein n=1 Tax=Brugia pahangi TaxID=6280 RepID=A0A0N4TD18_BRUPA|nr:unnamed protein product [Brugia pahangi]